MFKKASVFAAAAAAFLGLPTAPAQAQDFYIGQIILGGWNFCPRNTATAAGQILSINSNQALFSLYGCTYGGDCRTTFGLPDLRGRSPLNNGQGPGLSNIPLGGMGGVETITANINTLAPHTHAVTSTATTAVNVGPGAPGAYGAGEHIAANATIYAPNGTPNQPLDPASVGVTVTSTAANAGNGQQEFIRNPYLGLQYCVVLQGLFPPRS